MSEVFGIVTAKQCFLRQAPGIGDVEDEIFSGWAVRLIEEEKKGWVKVETHYGYKGYVKKSELRLIDRVELQLRQDKKHFLRIRAAEADLLSLPKVQGLPKELLLKNAVVELLEAEVAEGWSLVRTAARRDGYMHSVHLVERRDSDEYLLEYGMIGMKECCAAGSGSKEQKNRAIVCGGEGQENFAATCVSGNGMSAIILEKTGIAAARDNEFGKGYFRRICHSNNLDEAAFRQGLVKSALSYLGTQYRWGGKSSQGIDCSGLVFMSYLENGVLIYRDARMEEGYPMKSILKDELKPGDAIYFPGHVALYLGEGKYIHSTGHFKSAGVVINSLNPEDRDYREDLAQKIAAYGSIF